MTEYFYVVKIKKKVHRLGEENPMVRIVKPDDLESFLDAFAGESDKVKVKQVRVY